MMGSGMSGIQQSHVVLKAAKQALHIACFSALAAVALPLMAQASNKTSASTATSAIPYIVRTDYGGSVQRRMTDIQALQASQRRVEVRGEYCLSSCTMLLGLRNTCVDPRTTFGFHGPSRNGVPLTQDLFDHVTQIIAQHYPPQIRAWYMSVGRHTLTDMYQITGAELISLGAAMSCDPTRVYALRSASVLARGVG